MRIDITPQPRKRRVGRTLFNAACTAVTLVALAFVLPAAFGLERYVIAGGSMTGSISKGSVVLEEVVPVSDLRVGDVITYVPPPGSGVDTLVTHRIADIDGDTFRTKGDANATPDPWTFDLTAGTQPRVVHHVPLVGYPILALQDRGTRMLVIGGPAVVVALSSLVRLLRGLRRRTPQAYPSVPADHARTDVPVEV